jgi:hypothetical protein
MTVRSSPPDLTRAAGRADTTTGRAIATSPGWVAGIGLAGLAGLLAAGQLPATRGVPRLVLVLAMFALFVPSALAVQRLAPRVAVRVAVGGGLLLQLVALRVRPWMTDDQLRYAWDGRVQAAGIDPYRYVPGAPELRPLRDAWLFPDGVTPRLNHPGDRTIYPPVAEAWFWLVHVLSGGRGQDLPLQVGAAVLAVLVGGLLVRALRRTGGDPSRVVWWSWCPTVALEAGGNAHVDVLAALLLVGCLGLLAGRRATAAGVLLGLAVATKFLPALIAVGVPPRRWARVALPAAGVVAVVYLPHLLAVGTGVTGFLGGYLDQESHDQFDLLRFLLPDPVARPAGLAVLVGTAAWLWRRTAREDAAGAAPTPWRPAAAMVGVAFLVVTPPYPWYALLLVPLVALGAARIWLVVAAAVYPVYAAADLGHAYYGTRVLSYGAAALVLLAWAAHRRLRPRPVAGGHDV